MFVDTTSVTWMKSLNANIYYFFCEKLEYAVILTHFNVCIKNWRPFKCTDSLSYEEQTKHHVLKNESSLCSVFTWNILFSPILLHLTFRYKLFISCYNFIFIVHSFSSPIVIYYNKRILKYKNFPVTSISHERANPQAI